MYQNQKKFTVTETGVNANSKAEIYKVTTTDRGF